MSIDSGGSGGYGYFYIYSFKNNIPRQMFDVEKYNQDHLFDVNYEDSYKVRVESPQLDILFTIDISNKGYDYLSQYYDENGKLKQPVQGGALALGVLNPIVTNNKEFSYDLLAFQRIIGTTNSDTLGYYRKSLNMEWCPIYLISIECIYTWYKIKVTLLEKRIRIYIWMDYRIKD